MDLGDSLLFCLFYFNLHVNECTKRSCYDHLVDNRYFGVTPPDGVYNVTLNGDVMPVYCDMTTDGGGWTLLVAMVEGLNWTEQNILDRNAQAPGLSVDYSVLGKADYIKANAHGTHFQYALEATGRWRWGGRFSAPTTYSLVNYYLNQTDIQVLTKYDQWEFGGLSIGKSLPWIDLNHTCAILTTRQSQLRYFGTLVMRECNEWERFGPSPWLDSGSNVVVNATPIYYWLRENVQGYIETATLFPINNLDVSRQMTCDNVSRLVDKDLQTGLRLPGRGGPGCKASFAISIPSNSTSDNKFLVRVVGKSLSNENLILAHAEMPYLLKGWFKMCQMTKHKELEFICSMTTSSILRLVVFTKEEDIKVTEMSAIRMDN